MMPIEFLENIKEFAIDYREESIDSLQRNSHMHNASGAPNQEDIDAVLIDFINFIGRKYGVDYGMYAEDLEQ